MADEHTVTTWAVVSLHRVQRTRLVTSLAFVAVAAGSAVAATQLDWRLLVPLALGTPLATVAVLEIWHGADREPRTETPAYGGPLHSETFLAWTWVALLFGTTLQLLSGRRSVEAAASGNVSLDNLVELTAVCVAGAVVISAIRRGWTLRIPVVVALFGGYALLTVLSVSWSPLLLFSGARAFEFAVLAMFVAYCAGRAATEAGFADRLLERILRRATFIILILALWALAQGGFSLDRFTWPRIDPAFANHPDRPRGHAALLAFPIMALVFHPRRRQITWPLPWWGVVLFLLPLVHKTGSRSYTIAAVLAMVAALIVAGLRDTRVGALGLSAILVLTGMVTLTAAQPVLDFLLRNQDAQTVTGLNGRMELWSRVLAEPLGNEVWGIGVGAVRGGLPGHWNPPNTHSAWIEILQTLGVLGLSLMGALVLTVLATAVIRRSVPAMWMTVFVTIGSLTSVTLSQPGFTLILLCLAIVLVSTENESDVRSQSPELLSYAAP